MNIEVSVQAKRYLFVSFIRWAILLYSLLLSSLVTAEVRTNQELKYYVSNSMNLLLTKLKEHKDEYKQDSDLFYRDVNNELSKIIDFKRIAMKVMGRYGRLATKEQRKQFVHAFKNSLYQTYAQVLLDNNGIEFSVINATLNPQNPIKANAKIVIKSSSGSNFDISYALHKSNDKKYRIENIVIMGINLGLAYKDRFKQQIKANKGNIKTVIDNWSLDKAA